MNLIEAANRACEESDTLTDALNWIAVWEAERVIKQVREYDRTGVSTAYSGRGWDTCFKTCFLEVMKRWREKHAY